jgi:hypothetical protein
VWNGAFDLIELSKDLREWQIDRRARDGERIAIRFMKTLRITEEGLAAQRVENPYMPNPECKIILAAIYDQSISIEKYGEPAPVQLTEDGHAIELLCESSIGEKVLIPVY